MWPVATKTPLLHPFLDPNAKVIIVNGPGLRASEIEITIVRYTSLSTISNLDTHPYLRNSEIKWIKKKVSLLNHFELTNSGKYIVLCIKSIVLFIFKGPLGSILELLLHMLLVTTVMLEVSILINYFYIELYERRKLRR